MSNAHKPGCEALGGYGNGVGACACTPDKQAAPSEWVERMDLRFTSGNEHPVTVARIKADEWADLRAHLESREALVKQLAEALELLLEEEEAGTVCNMDRRNARAALAAHKQHVALQEKT